MSLRTLFAAACVLAFAAPSFGQDCRNGQCQLQRSAAAFGVPVQSPCPCGVSCPCAGPSARTAAPARPGVLGRVRERLADRPRLLFVRR